MKFLPTWRGLLEVKKMNLEINSKTSIRRSGMKKKLEIHKIAINHQKCHQNFKKLKIKYLKIFGRAKLEEGAKNSLVSLK